MKVPVEWEGLQALGETEMKYSGETGRKSSGEGEMNELKASKTSHAGKECPVSASDPAV